MGDVILLSPGDVIPADCILIESRGLEYVQAPVDGSGEILDPLQDHIVAPDSVQDLYLLFKDSTIVKGVGKCVVCAVGVNTQLYTNRKLKEETRVELKARSEDTCIEENIDRFYVKFAKVKTYASISVFSVLCLVWAIKLAFFMG